MHEVSTPVVVAPGQEPFNTDLSRPKHLQVGEVSLGPKVPAVATAEDPPFLPNLQVRLPNGPFRKQKGRPEFRAASSHEIIFISVQTERVVRRDRNFALNNIDDEPHPGLPEVRYRKLYLLIDVSLKEPRSVCRTVAFFG